MGLISLICNESIDLVGKNILMFSYGSGNAASMFVVRGNSDYHDLAAAAQFKDRLAN